jgi:hypothetical protein
MLREPSLLARAVAALAVLLVPAAASAATSSHGPSHKPSEVLSPSAPSHGNACGSAPVEIVAGNEAAKVAFGRCDREPSAAAVDELSILSRPAAAARPTEPLDVLVKRHGAEIAPGVRRLDARLVDRLRLVADHFAKDGQTTRVDLVSGFRPRGSGSFHSSGRALDFRVEGVKNDALVAFCKTLPDTGCGFYPNDVFVHMDVRDEGTGHVAWVDANAPTDLHRDAARSSTTPAGGGAPEPAAVVQADRAPAERAACPAAALGLSLAVPVSAAGPTTVAAAPAAPAAAPATELPPLPGTQAGSAHPDKVSRAHHGRKTRPRHHAI